MMGVKKAVYNRAIRPRVREKIGMYNWVAVRNLGLLDETDEFYRYKAPNCAALREHVEPSDRVVIVGGGLGVTAVVAARRADRVDVYEGGADTAKEVKRTVSLNGVTARVKVHPMIVGRAKNLKSSPMGCRCIGPEEMRDCDVLELDCEGAELDIIKRMDQTPRVVTVETHPYAGVETADVRSQLEGDGYRIDDSFETDHEGKVIVGVSDGR